MCNCYNLLLLQTKINSCFSLDLMVAGKLSDQNYSYYRQKIHLTDQHLQDLYWSLWSAWYWGRFCPLWHGNSLWYYFILLLVMTDLDWHRLSFKNSSANDNFCSIVVKIIKQLPLTHLLVKLALVYNASWIQLLQSVLGDIRLGLPVSVWSQGTLQESSKCPKIF